MNAAALATLGACAAYARRRLPRFEAELLVCRAANADKARLYAYPEHGVAPGAGRLLDGWVARRAAGEPIAYILGERGFWNLELEVTPSALIPRPETETLVAAALELIAANARVADIGTGCGAVALAIAAARPEARVLATDVDAACVALCERNAARLGLRVETAVADLLRGVSGRFDVIVSNPPYVAAADPHLRRGDLRFEPRHALVGGATGVEMIAQLVGAAPARLRSGGWLAVEHGRDQAASITALFAGAGFAAITMRRDWDGRPRVTFGQAP